MEKKMNKKIFVFGLIFLFICICLSGCNNQTGQTTGDSDKIELVSYNVETYGELSKKLGDGFVHSEDAVKYEITGTIKNIAGYTLEQLEITAKFYDKNDMYLDSLTVTMFGIQDTYTEDFTIRATSSGLFITDIDGFESVESVRFEFEAL
jgi:hypothetical protein